MDNNNFVKDPSDPIKTINKSPDDVVVKLRETEIDPFTFELNPSWIQIFKIAFMSITIAPIKFIAFINVFLFTYLIAVLGLIGIDQNVLESGRPLKGFRRKWQNFCLSSTRAMFFTMGIYNVNIKGRQAKFSEAPMLVVAPHATIVDALAIIKSGAVPLAKDDFKKMPILGKIARFLQIMFVKRESKGSRSEALNKIKDFVTKKHLPKDGFTATKTKDERTTLSSDSCKSACDDSRRQLLIFPEGTCTNGKALIHFKLGAFLNGTPVQPVALRIGVLNNPDTTTWAWNQSYGAWGCFLLTLCHFYTKVEIEFLPPITPTEAEKLDPAAFGRNVRLAMSKALNLPIVDLKLEDGKKAARKTSVIKKLEEDLLGNLVLGDDILEDDEDVVFDLHEKNIQNEPKNGNVKNPKNYVDFTGSLTLMS